METTGNDVMIDGKIPAYYLSQEKVAPAIVIACHIMGVDEDTRQIARDWHAKGMHCIAPDIFWDSAIHGVVPRGDPRVKERLAVDRKVFCFEGGGILFRGLIEAAVDSFDLRAKDMRGRSAIFEGTRAFF